MGINLRAREAEEKSKAAYSAVSELVGVVKKQELMLNALSQMVYEMSNRQTAMEIVTDHMLGLQGLKAQEIIEGYIAKEQAKAEAEVAAREAAEENNESTTTTTDAATESPTELVGVSESTSQGVTA